MIVLEKGVPVDLTLQDLDFDATEQFYTLPPIQFYDGTVVNFTIERKDTPFTTEDIFNKDGKWAIVFSCADKPEQSFVILDVTDSDIPAGTGPEEALLQQSRHYATPEKALNMILELLNAEDE